LLPATHNLPNPKEKISRQQQQIVAFFFFVVVVVVVVVVLLRRFCGGKSRAREKHEQVQWFRAPNPNPKFQTHKKDQGFESYYQ
jgi:heme/copper-type cytochrome/quinol oxidase subunit 2